MIIPCNQKSPPPRSSGRAAASLPAGSPRKWSEVEVAGIDRENEGKIMGKPTQTMEKCWENAAKMRMNLYKPWKNDGKWWDILWWYNIKPGVTPLKIRTQIVPIRKHSRFIARVRMPRWVRWVLRIPSFCARCYSDYSAIIGNPL